jgi:hypothetical protein
MSADAAAAGRRSRQYVWDPLSASQAVAIVERRSMPTSEAAQVS